MFWKTYPIQNIFKAKWNTKPFEDLRFEREPVTFPLEIKMKKTNRIKYFLKDYFGNPPKTPVLDIPEDKLYGTKDVILYVEDKYIIGCVRYHYIGTFLDKEIYCVDCFCIHPLWRKKGVGDYLLTMLHIYVNKHNIPYSLFLKEGNLNVLHPPLYSSIYVYRKTEKSDNSVIDISIVDAYKLIDIYCECNPIFVIKNRDNKNQHWKLYKKGKVLACIQDTYQRFEGNKIGWITAWICLSSTSTSNTNSAKQISDSMYGTFDYIWGNKKWTGNSKEWKNDGPFHWYSYQWTSALSFNSYCILM